MCKGFDATFGLRQHILYSGSIKKQRKSKVKLGFKLIRELNATVIYLVSLEEGG